MFFVGLNVTVNNVCMIMMNHDMKTYRELEQGYNYFSFVSFLIFFVFILFFSGMAWEIGDMWI